MIDIEQARRFVLRLSRTREIPSGLSIAISVLFDKAEESYRKIKALQAEINKLKSANPGKAVAKPIDLTPPAIAFNSNEWALGAKVPMHISQGETP